jgi:hypothetical protein
MSEVAFMKMTALQTGLIYLINHYDIMYFTYDKKSYKLSAFSMSYKQASSGEYSW